MTGTPMNLGGGGNHILELAGNEFSSLGLKPISQNGALSTTC